MCDGWEIAVGALMAEAGNREFVTAAGGGVTTTGCELLLQPAFTAEVLRCCNEVGLYVLLDGSGFLSARATGQFLADTDLVLVNIKYFYVNT